MEKVLFDIQMVRITRVCGKMTEGMERVLGLFQMVRSTLARGRGGNLMGRENWLLLMAKFMLVTGSWEKGMVMVKLHFQTKILMSERGNRIK